MNRKQYYKGFTLIELLVVIAIIGILASIVFVSLSGAQNRAKDARIIADMGQMRSTAMVFHGNNGTYYIDGTKDVCKDPDILGLIGDIGNQGGTSTTCFVQAVNPNDNYCVKTQLNSGKWWCVDSTLVSQQSDGEPDCGEACDYCFCN